MPVLFGLVLVSLPTYFGTFPSDTNWNIWVRIAIITAWVVAAVVGIFLTAKADESLHKEVEKQKESVLGASNRIIMLEKFRSMLVPGLANIPTEYQLTVYAPSSDKQFLVPVYPPVLNNADPAIFAPGAGATGQAWENPGTVFVVIGSGISDDTHSLTGIQQRRSSIFNVVAATVITDENDRSIGVLSALGHKDDDFFRTEPGGKALREVANTIAWAIPDAVKWLMLKER